MVKTNKKSPNYPSQVKQLIEEIKLKINSDPLDERLVLVGKSNFHRGSSEEYFQSYVSSVLIETANDMDSLLEQVGRLTGNFSRLGQPIFYHKKYDQKNVYEVSEVFEENGTTLEAFVIEKEDPTLYTTFEPRQDFTLFYSLFDEIQKHNKIWNDHKRRTNKVITFEREENKSELKISKDYVLDYLFLRKKWLLLYSYYMYVVKAEDNVPDKYRQEFNIVERKKRATITTVRDNRYGEQLVVKAEIMKLILQPTSRTLGDFGVLPQIPNIDFMTNNGKISIQNYSSHNLSDFLSIVFF